MSLPPASTPRRVPWRRGDKAARVSERAARGQQSSGNNGTIHCQPSQPLQGAQRPSSVWMAHSALTGLCFSCHEGLIKVLSPRCLGAAHPSLDEK
ncbi:hypothetical protein E2C01_025228 [Portunus trituberculatus]|uniref:Uncharacterized protein n=1 Tax=Portunus trituberculatus TaxID=210409 RepID=A0A5B7EEM1_PORTR|nr:hypothetical protein [Portunus trituberculatus]